jgi:formylglycine-generating enzyme required for sulfatase activity
LQNHLTEVGAYTSSLSPYGTFDQGGNVWEWNEALNITFQNRTIRGGAWSTFLSFGDDLHASTWGTGNSTGGADTLGFRVATFVPEPSTLLLIPMACLGFFLRRRRYS